MQQKSAFKESSAGLILVAIGLIAGCSSNPVLQEREAAGRMLGQAVASAGDKFLVLGNPFTQQKDQKPEIHKVEEATLAGLKQGLGTRTMKVAYPELRADFLRDRNSVWVDPKTTTPLSFLLADRAVDRVIEANPGFPVIISLIGIPAGLEKTKAWQKSKFAFLLPDWRILGGRDPVRAAFQEGRILAAIQAHARTTKPAANATPPEPFILITPQNFQELIDDQAVRF